MSKSSGVFSVRAENKAAVSRINDIIQQCLKKRIKVFSYFITPAQMEDVIKTVQTYRDVKYMAFGGNDQCERRMLGFCPDYMDISQNDFPVDVIKISTNKKFSTEMSHRDYLGSILGLGIDRSKIGDIIVFDGSALCYVKKEISDYISTNLVKVGRNNVLTEVFDIENIELPEVKTEEKSYTVPSLRLDAVAGGAFNLARGKIQDLIEGEKVFINFITEVSPSKNVSARDIISVCGFGRIKVLSINGRTKKDRISITVLKYV